MGVSAKFLIFDFFLFNMFHLTHFSYVNWPVILAKVAGKEDHYNALLLVEKITSSAVQLSPLGTKMKLISKIDSNSNSYHWLLSMLIR